MKAAEFLLMVAQHSLGRSDRSRNLVMLTAAAKKHV